MLKESQGTNVIKHVVKADQPVSNEEKMRAEFNQMYAGL